MSKRKERIRELEEELARLKEEEEGELEPELVWEKLLDRARKEYLGKSIVINNEENGCFWIREVEDIWIDSDMLIFRGSGVEYCEDGFIISCDRGLAFSEELEAPVMCSDPNYYDITDWIEVFSSPEEMKEDILKVVRETIDEYIQ